MVVGLCVCLCVCNHEIIGCLWHLTSACVTPPWYGSLTRTSVWAGIDMSRTDVNPLTHKHTAVGLQKQGKRIGEEQWWMPNYHRINDQETKLVSFWVWKNRPRKIITLTDPSVVLLCTTGNEETLAISFIVVIVSKFQWKDRNQHFAFRCIWDTQRHRMYFLFKE